jgi:hypothetical protein
MFVIATMVSAPCPLMGQGLCVTWRVVEGMDGSLCTTNLVAI